MKHLKADIFNSDNNANPEFSFIADSPNGAGYGFGGATVCDLNNVVKASRASDVVFFGTDSEIARHYGNHNQGAATFVRQRTYTMLPWTQARAADCYDIGNIKAEDPESAIRAVRLISRDLTRIGLRPVFIGCDHTASIAVATGVSDGRRKPFTYLYIDAHYDLGFHNVTDGLHNGSFIQGIMNTERIERVVNVGGRCLSNYAPVYHSIPGFLWIPGAMNRTSGGTIRNDLSWLKGASLYVSIDADALDPSCAPNVSCPEPFGMSAHELLSVCEWLGRHCDVIGADLCEILPLQHSMESERALMHCLLSLFPKNKALMKSKR